MPEVVGDPIRPSEIIVPDIGEDTAINDQTLNQSGAKLFSSGANLYFQVGHSGARLITSQEIVA